MLVNNYLKKYSSPDPADPGSQLPGEHPPEGNPPQGNPPAGGPLSDPEVSDLSREDRNWWRATWDTFAAIDPSGKGFEQGQKLQGKHGKEAQEQAHKELQQAIHEFDSVAAGPGAQSAAQVGQKAIRMFQALAKLRAAQGHASAGPAVLVRPFADAFGNVKERVNRARNAINNARQDPRGPQRGPQQHDANDRRRAADPHDPGEERPAQRQRTEGGPPQDPPDPPATPPMSLGN